MSLETRIRTLEAKTATLQSLDEDLLAEVVLAVQRIAEAEGVDQEIAVKMLAAWFEDEPNFAQATEFLWREATRLREQKR